MATANGGRPYTMTPAHLRLAQAAMAERDTKGSGHESALYAPFARTNGDLMRPELTSHFAGA
jgi:hypothetical protein